MNRSKLIALGLGAAAALSLGVASSRRTPPAADPPATTTSVAGGSERGLAPDPWTDGGGTDVTIAYHVETRGPSSRDASSNGSVRVDVDATLEPCEARSGTSRFLAATITRARHVEVRVVGGDLAPLADLVGQRAYLEMAGDRVERVHLARDASPLTKQLLQGMLRGMQLTRPEPGAERWGANEPGLHGVGPVTYRSTSASSIERTRERYDELSVVPGARPELVHVDGKTRIELAPSAAIASLREDEVVTVRGADGSTTFASRASFGLVAKGPSSSARGEARCVVPESSELEARSALELEAQAVGRKMYEEAAAGRTVGEVESMVLDFARSGRPPESAELVRSIAMLLAHPEHSSRIARLAADGRVGKKGRQLAMDVLASAGHAQAQAAMRSLFESGAVAIDDPAYGLLVQRFSFVDSPDPANVALLEAARATARARRLRTAHHAATFALGSTIGRLARTDAAAAERASERLAAELAVEPTADGRVALLAALGNAGLARDVEAIASHASDPDEDVRAQVATSLRRYSSPHAREVLLDLLGDRSARVANHALDGFTELHRSPEDVRVVARRVADRRSHPELDAKIVELLAGARDRSEAVRDALSVMRARATGGRQSARIDELLRALA